MSSRSAEVVICGAGIAGIAAAYHLAVRRDVRGVVLVDEGSPLSLTSDKSMECYRNWWPGPGDDMVALMNRSIDLLEELARESDNLFRLNRRGYLFATADPGQVPVFVERAREAAARGVGPARVHTGAASDYRPAPADGFEDQPTGVDVVLGAGPRSARLTIWPDPICRGWTDEERTELAGSAEHKRLVEEFPGGVHGRPEGAGESPVVLLIWTYDIEPVEPTFPIRFDPAYGEICLRGMSRMIPALGAYLPRLPRVFVDSGYYMKTRENRLLAGQLPLEGAYVLGALSGYGQMSSNGAADLLADHITGRALPRYAPAFLPARYDDPEYRALLEQWEDSGQL